MKIGEFKKVALNKIHEYYSYEKRTPMYDYETALDEILNISDEEEMTLEDIKEELPEEDDLREYADGLVDTSTDVLLKWYLEDVDRVSYMEDAIKELCAEDGFQVLSGGQYLYWEEVLNEVYNACLETLEAMEDENDEIEYEEEELEEWEKKRGELND